MNRAADWRSLHDATAPVLNQNGWSILSTGLDPYLMSKPLNFSSETFQAIRITMRVDKGSQGQIFWVTDRYADAAEIRSQHFALKSDGEFHTYTLSFTRDENWSGTITGLRFDPTDAKSTVEVREFAIIERNGPRMNLLRLEPDKPYAKPNEPIHVNATVENLGDVAGGIVLKLFRDGFEVDDSKVLTVEPGQRKSYSWLLQSRQKACEWVICKWSDDIVSSAPFQEKGSIGTLVQWQEETSDRSIPICDDISCVEWIPSKAGYGLSKWKIKRDEQWVDMAVMPRLATVYIKLQNGQTETWPVMAEQPKVVSDDAVGYEENWADSDGITWSFRMQVQKDTQLPGVYRIRQVLESDGGELLHFSGTELYVGEGSFGTEKDLAVFPGIEYLGKDDVSSSDAVAHPPVRDQFMPHPYKVTIPLMALSHENKTIALLWPPGYEWAKGEHSLSSKCSMPNRYQNQQNHLMGLFVPTVPDYVLENESIAYRSFPMKKGQPVTIESAVYLGPGNDPLKAVDVWLKLYSNGTLPEPAKSPRSYEEEMAVSRKAYLDTCWNEGAKGWGHCAGWAPISSGGMLALLELDAFLCHDHERKRILNQRVELVKEHILDTRGPAGLGDASGCHVMTVEPGFFWGVMEYKLPEWIGLAKHHGRIQNPDGSWGFHPAKEEQKPLGQEGEVVSGTISPNAMFLMQLARISGDPGVTKIGLKGVDALNRYLVPRGSQGWECPLAAGDIMVSARATTANVDAWRVTGDKHYFEKAVYWAQTGLAFHYLWNLEDRPLQRYATIPIFGATFFSHSWRGVPVQWCGLVYAYALQYLAGYDDSHDWKRMARGIVNSAMLQQITEGDYAGTLPDSYGDWFTEARPAFINPENIMTNLHELEGNGFNIRTAFLDESSSEALRISANADIVNARHSNGTIEFDLVSKSGRMSEIVIVPTDTAPKQVTVDGKTISSYSELFGKDFGWRYLNEYNALFIHVQHRNESLTVNIEE